MTKREKKIRMTLRSRTRYINKESIEKLKKKIKLNVVRRLVDQYFETDPYLSAVYLITFGEKLKAIKLLEVSDGTFAAGVMPFTFAATAEIPYKVTIATITLGELRDLRRHPEKFPRGWSLDGSKRFTRKKKRKT